MEEYKFINEIEQIFFPKRKTDISVLVVDDEKNILEILTYHCKRLNLITYSANNYNKAIEIFEEKRPDFLIIDHFLDNNKTGFDILCYIKKNYNLNIPFILITALKEEEKLWEYVHLIAFKIIYKPFNIIEVKNSILQLVNKINYSKNLENSMNNAIKIDCLKILLVNLFLSLDEGIFIVNNKDNSILWSNKYFSNINIFEEVLKNNYDKILHLQIQNERIIIENNKVYKISLYPFLQYYLEFECNLNLVIIEDITKEFELLEQIKKQNEIIAKAERLTNIGQLLANFMHEINNPNTYILGNTQNLKIYFNLLLQKIKECLKEVGKKEKIDEIENSKVIKIIQDLINKTEIGAKKIKHIVYNIKTFLYPPELQNKAVVDLKEVIENSLELLSAKSKYITEIDFKISENIKKVEGLKQELEQAIINIINNALDELSEKKDGDRLIEIKLEYDERKERDIIRIKDNGRGIPEEIRKKIFNPFFTTKEIGKGSGLGLYVTKTIIENHNGEIYINTDIGKGTEFIIELPVIKEEENNEKKNINN